MSTYTESFHLDLTSAHLGIPSRRVWDSSFLQFIKSVRASSSSPKHVYGYARAEERRRRKRVSSFLVKERFLNPQRKVLRSYIYALMVPHDHKTK